MKIEEGKFYRTRGGDKVGPMHATGAARSYYLWGRVNDVDKVYQEDGTHGSAYIDNERAFDLISEWTEPTGPVRTVTRKEIVPGFYGRLMVTKLDGTQQAPDEVGVCLLNRSGNSSSKAFYLNAAELRETAAVLTEIADALDEAAA